MTVDLGTRNLGWQVESGVAYCTLDRPKRRNAMTASMYVGVRRAVQILNGSPKLHALVITGAGDTFCPGGEMGGEHDDGPAGLEAAAAFGNEIVPFEAIRSSRKPVVAMVNGLCQGGGLLMTLVSDLAVVSDRATFRVPEIARGVADTYYAAYLPAHVGLLRGAPEARWQMKRIVNERYGHVDRMTIDASVAGPEAREGFQSFVEKRAPSWIPDGYAPDGRM